MRAFESGADDFIAKPYDPKELLARVDAAGRRWFNADRQTLGNVLRVGNAELAISDMKFIADGRQPVHLTPTEMRLLECMMRNSSITITRETLIDRAWPNDFIADTNRVDVYVGRLRRKIERHPAEPEYIHTVRGVGYVFRPPATDHVVELPLERTTQPQVHG
jgi:DNA-binding response OmpR family regulator